MYFCGINNCDTWCENLNRHYESGEHDLIVEIRVVKECKNCVDLNKHIETLEMRISKLLESKENLEKQETLHPFRRMR